MWWEGVLTNAMPGRICMGTMSSTTLDNIEFLICKQPDQVFGAHDCIVRAAQGAMGMQLAGRLHGAPES